MRTGANLSVAVLVTAAVYNFAAVPAQAGEGWFWFGCKSRCNACCCDASPCASCKECKLKKLCPDAPRAEISFAVPAVFRGGHAVRVSDEALRRGVRDAAAREFKDEHDRAFEGEEDRLDRLEKDVSDLKDITAKLATLLSELNAKVDTLNKP